MTGWLDTLHISQAVCEELRLLGPVANWSAEPYSSTYRTYVANHRSLHMVDYLA